jgi:hypothetical protein
MKVALESYSDLAGLAQLCAKQAHIATSREVAREFWRSALGYQKRAAALDGGKLPDIGSAPAEFKE